MIRGIYAAASSMVSNRRRELIVANNLANVSTDGYKQDVAVPSDFPSMPVVGTGETGNPLASPWEAIGSVGTGMDLSEILVDVSQGDLVETGNPLDLAITGSGFFTVQTANGTLYTRDGTFFRDPNGNLARADGGLLLGDKGPIQVGQGDVVVDGDGTVSVGGKVAGKIKLSDFDPKERLVKVGNNYLTPADPNAQVQAAKGAAVSQGFVERSNVDLNRQMVEMMSAMRSYEANQKIITLQDQMLGLTVNEVGKV